MTVSEFSRGRAGTEPSSRPRLLAGVRSLIARALSWPGKAMSSAFVRVLAIFLIGFVAGVGWQAYGGGLRKTVAGWSPRLAWVAPAAAGTSAERLRATSLALASVRQSVDKLGTEISKLQAEDDAPRRRRR